MYQARPDATEVCTIGDHTPRSRSIPATPPAATLASKAVSSGVLMTLAYRSALARCNVSVLAALQLEQRNHPGVLGLVFREARRHGGDFREELPALRGRQFAGRHVERVGTDLDVRPRVGP